MLKKSSSSSFSLSGSADSMLKTHEFLLPPVVGDRGITHYYQRCIQELNNMKHVSAMLDYADCYLVPVLGWLPPLLLLICSYNIIFIIIQISSIFKAE